MAAPTDKDKDKDKAAVDGIISPIDSSPQENKDYHPILKETKASQEVKIFNCRLDLRPSTAAAVILKAACTADRSTVPCGRVRLLELPYTGSAPVASRQCTHHR